VFAPLLIFPVVRLLVRQAAFCVSIAWSPDFCSFGAARFGGRTVLGARPRDLGLAPDGVPMARPSNQPLEATGRAHQLLTEMLRLS